MKKASASLLTGLAECCKASNEIYGSSYTFQLGWLSGDVADLIEGSAPVKKAAHTRLQKLIGRGRCILNASELTTKSHEEKQL